MVDGGWSNCAHKHSYNAKSGVAVIFGAATKKLLFIGIQNKYCSVCSVSEHKKQPLPEHHCFKNWSDSLCSMEADILLEGFLQSETMHGLRYKWLIGDGDSSVYNAVSQGVLSYGRHIVKIECANHVIKCCRNRMEDLCKQKLEYKWRNALSTLMIKRTTHGARTAIRSHSVTKDVEALRHDLRNGPRHCFGDHSKCVSEFCKHKDKETTGKFIYNVTIIWFNHIYCM